MKVPQARKPLPKWMWKLLGILLLVIGVLFGSRVNNVIVALGLNFTFVNYPLEKLPYIGTPIVTFVISTTFIGLNVIGLQLGINWIILMGLIVLIVS